MGDGQSGTDLRLLGHTADPSPRRLLRQFLGQRDNAIASPSLLIILIFEMFRNGGEIHSALQSGIQPEK